MSTKLPNFLIVGAAKCGTTSVHNYLMQHPEIFMSNEKEPKYFSSQVVKFPFQGPGDDAVEREICKDWNHYKSLFKVHSSERIIGESSADNLYYSSKVIPLIKEKLGEDVKVLILLRNPVERAFSAFMHLKRDLREKHISFKDALDAEEDRINNNYEFIWHYKNAGVYSEAIKNYQDSFSNVKVVLSEDLIKNTTYELKQICEFLGVDDNFQFSIRQNFNSSGSIRNHSLQKILASSSPLKRKLGKLFPQSWKDRLKSKNLEKTEILESDRKAPTLYFRDDIKKTEKILDRDLSNWLK